MFLTPQVNLYTHDVPRSRAFYGALGFSETFRTPLDGPPIHVELVLDGFRLGIAAVESAVDDHGLDVDLTEPGRGMEICLWTDDVDAAYKRLLALGATPMSEPHDWLEHLRVAWVRDPDDHPVEIVQHRRHDAPEEP